MKDIPLVRSTVLNRSGEKDKVQSKAITPLKRFKSKKLKEEAKDSEKLSKVCYSHSILKKSTKNASPSPQPKYILGGSVCVLLSIRFIIIASAIDLAAGVNATLTADQITDKVDALTQKVAVTNDDAEENRSLLSLCSPKHLYVWYQVSTFYKPSFWYWPRLQQVLNGLQGIIQGHDDAFAMTALPPVD